MPDDDALLADLFRRLFRADALRVEPHFRPTYHLTLETSAIHHPIILTDPEVDVLRRTL